VCVGNLTKLNNQDKIAPLWVNLGRFNSSHSHSLIAATSTVAS
jgi:hypothetical protein